LFLAPLLLFGGLFRPISNIRPVGLAAPARFSPLTRLSAPTKAIFQYLHLAILYLLLLQFFEMPGLPKIDVL